MEKICGIYKITSPKNRIYIGQSIDVSKRIASYKRLSCKSQTRLYNSLKKYGIDAHKFEVIHQCESHELGSLEIYYIQLYDTFNSRYGLNLRSGGAASSSMSIESRNKMSESQKKKIGALNSFYGRRHSDETKKKWSEKRKGVKLSDETKLKIGLAGIGRKATINQINAIKKTNERIWGNEIYKLKMTIGRRGENNPYNKLSENDVFMIRKMGDINKITHQKIADKFMVSRKCVGNILNGKIWGWLK